MRQWLIAGASAACFAMSLGGAQAMPATTGPAASLGQAGLTTDVAWNGPRGVFRGGGVRGGNFARGGFRGGQFARGGYGGPRYYGNRGWGGGAAVGAGVVGLATGAIIGGALAAPRTYDYGPDYYGSGSYAPAPVYVDPDASEGYYSGSPGADEAYCIRRYRSYDPASGTFLGYDGLRHPCPS